MRSRPRHEPRPGERSRCPRSSRWYIRAVRPGGPRVDGTLANRSQLVGSIQRQIRCPSPRLDEQMLELQPDLMVRLIDAAVAR